MSKLTRWMDRAFYPSFQDKWDNQIFREIVLPHLDRSSTVLLDAGAGRGYLEHMNFRDQVRRAIGVDPSPEVKGNPFLHESYIGMCDDMPFLDSESVDIAVSNNVLEHVETPRDFLAEVHRVLKPGGLLVVKTPNFWHYMALMATVTPTWFHTKYNRWRGRPTADTFPTQYRINTRHDLYRLASQAGFCVEEFKLVEGRPEYLRIAAPLYAMGIVYERMVNCLRIDRIKIVYFATLRKL
ncbi:class I SAM-dependent methyltransferase [Allorhodopirellula solitaria]|uniref:Putative methyltransferase n=1 Tax=Allorhodopirellula solitaria TaxID=2527987 RepID=A0A5C5XQY5_9BACT|nr:class I SAM-dependent methyltransferase [Allorhodopirellula solitaria]TWT65049.1 putative methyltransferase [Allorhodopirellula solitaria]